MIVNPADTVSPAATDTAAGTAAAALLLASATNKPAAGAGPFRVTVLPVVVVPPNTEFGASVTTVGLGASTVNIAVAVAPPYVAVIVTGVITATAVVAIVNAGDTDAPAGTVTIAGTAAAALLLASVTTAPPAGASSFSVTVFNVVIVPPSTDPGLNATPVTTAGVVLLFTVTASPRLLIEFPARSVATAVSKCGPLLAVVVSQLMLYVGPAPVTALPRFAPSNWNCRPVNAVTSVAFAVSVTVPLSRLPAPGAVTATANGNVITANSSMMSSSLLYPPSLRYSYAPRSKFDAALQFAAGGEYPTDFTSDPFRYRLLTPLPHASVTRNITPLPNNVSSVPAGTK